MRFLNSEVRLKGERSLATTQTKQKTHVFLFSFSIKHLDGQARRTLLVHQYSSNNVVKLDFVRLVKYNIVA